MELSCILAVISIACLQDVFGGEHCLKIQQSSNLKIAGYRYKVVGVTEVSTIMLMEKVKSLTSLLTQLSSRGQKSDTNLKGVLFINLAICKCLETVLYKYASEKYKNCVGITKLTMHDDEKLLLPPAITQHINPVQRLEVVKDSSHAKEALEWSCVNVESKKTYKNLKYEYQFILPAADPLSSHVLVAKYSKLHIQNDLSSCWFHFENGTLVPQNLFASVSSDEALKEFMKYYATRVSEAVIYTSKPCYVVTGDVEKLSTKFKKKRMKGAFEIIAKSDEKLLVLFSSLKMANIMISGLESKEVLDSVCEKAFAILLSKSKDYKTYRTPKNDRKAKCVASKISEHFVCRRLVLTHHEAGLFTARRSLEDDIIWEICADKISRSLFKKLETHCEAYKVKDHTPRNSTLSKDNFEELLNPNSDL